MCALRVDQSQSRTRLTPLVGMGLWLASVVVTTLLASVIVWGVKKANGPIAVIPNQGLWGLPEQKSSALRKIFDGHKPAAVHPRKEEIETFLLNFTNQDEEQSSKWKEVRDDERFRDRVLKSNYVRLLPRRERQMIAEQPISEFWAERPTRFQHLALVHIAPWAEFGLQGTSKPLDDELVVFAYGRSEYDKGEPVVFWLKGPVGQLKLTDWEYINSGIAESEHAGFYESANRDPAATELFRFYHYIRAADELNYSDKEKFEATMKLAEECQVPRAWEDLARYILIVRWSNWSRHDEVCRLADQVKNLDRIPGIIAHYAASRSRLGQDDRALALIAISANLVGFRPDLSELRARILTNQRSDEAIAQWQRLVDFDPSDVSQLGELFQVLPKARRSEVIERIKSLPDSAKLAVRFAQYHSQRLTLPMLQELARHVAMVSPDSSEARDIEILQLRSQGDFAAAAQIHRLAAERESDPVVKKAQWADYLVEMHSAGQVLAGFEVHPDPRAAFRTLVLGVEESESAVTTDELPPILAAYRKFRPDDPLLAYYEGYVAAHQQNYQKADECFLAAERLISKEKQAAENDPKAKDDDNDGDDLDSDTLTSMICRERCRARYELGDDIEVLSLYPKSEEAYQVIAAKAVDYRQWSVLDRINEAFRRDEPSNPWLAFYSVRLAIAHQELQNAHDLLKEMATREAELPLMKYFRSQLQREIAAAEIPEPLRRFELSDDRKEMFAHVSHLLLDEQDWAGLDKVCRLHPDGPDCDDVAMLRLDQAWKQDNAKELVQRLTPWPEKLFVKQRYQASIWRERLVRSLLRLEQRDQAMAIALDAKQRFGERWPLIMTWVASREAEKFEELLNADDGAMEEWGYRNLADDRELRPLLENIAFANFRKHFALDLTVYDPAPTITILLNKPSEISEEWLSSRLAESKTPDSQLLISRLSPTRLIVCWNQTRFLLTSVAQPYFAADILEDPAVAKHWPDLPADTRQVFAQQQSYWQITSLGGTNQEPWNRSDHECRQLAARLLNDDAVGVMHREWLSDVVTVLPIDATQADKLAAYQSPFALDQHAIILQNRRPQPRKLDDEKRQTLRTMAAKTPAVDEANRLTLTVQLTDGDHPWIENFQLLELRPQRYGQLEVVAEYRGPDHSNSLPELRPGIRYVVPFGRIVDISQP